MKNIRTIIMKFLFKTGERQEQKQVIKPRIISQRKPKHFRKSSF